MGPNKAGAPPLTRALTSIVCISIPTSITYCIIMCVKEMSLGLEWFKETVVNCAKNQECAWPHVKSIELCCHYYFFMNSYLHCTLLLWLNFRLTKQITNILSLCNKLVCLKEDWFWNSFQTFMNTIFKIMNIQTNGIFKNIIGIKVALLIRNNL